MTLWIELWLAANIALSTLLTYFAWKRTVYVTDLFHAICRQIGSEMGAAPDPPTRTQEFMSPADLPSPDTTMAILQQQFNEMIGKHPDGFTGGTFQGRPPWEPPPTDPQQPTT